MHLKPFAPRHCFLEGPPESNNLMTPIDVTGEKGGSPSDAYRRRWGAKGNAYVSYLDKVVVALSSSENLMLGPSGRHWLCFEHGAKFAALQLINVAALIGHKR